MFVINEIQGLFEIIVGEIIAKSPDKHWICPGRATRAREGENEVTFTKAKATCTKAKTTRTKEG